MDLRSALVCASSPDPDIRASGDQILQSCERHPGFYSNLWHLMDHEHDMKLKTLGLLYFKNGIDKYWRKNARNGITEEEKQVLRPMIMDFFGSHESKVLNNSHSLIVAKIARYDFPNYWPLLIDQLQDVIRSSFTGGVLAFQIHGLYTLHLVIKTLASKTLSSSRAQFMNISPPIFEFLIRIFDEFLQSFFSAITVGNLDEASRNLEISLLAIKSCRRLLVYGYSDFSQNAMALEFYKRLVVVNQEMIKIRMHSEQLSQKVNKVIILIGKIYMDLQERDVVQFISTPGLLDIVAFYWKILQDYTPGDDVTFDKVLLQALNIMKLLVKNSEFNIVSDDDNVKARRKVAQSYVNSSIFTPDFTRTFLQLLVSRYICLSKEDLEFWKEEPEQFVQEEEADHWEYNVRLCSEKLVIDLVSQHRETLAPVILSMVDAASKNQIGINIKESTYCVLGLCADNLAEYVDFSGLLGSFMINETLNKTNDFKIIRRQVALVIKSWISVKISKQFRPLVYEALLNLSDDSDPVVKLTSVICLRQCIDDFDFELEDFMPFVNATIGKCLNLIDEYEEYESKLCMLNTISVLVLRLEEKSAPFAPQILSVLSNQWQHADSQHLFKSSIVSIVASLISALGGETYALPVAIPIIQSALNTNDPSHIYILEEGLDLCMAVVQNTKKMTQELYEIIPMIINLLDYGTESLKSVLKILALIVILSPDNVFKDYGHGIISKLSILVGSLVPEASKLILNLLDTCIQVQNPPSQILLKEINSSGIFRKMVIETINSQELMSIIMDYNCILSRIILTSPESFIAGFKSLENSDQILTVYIDQLISRFDSLPGPNQRVLVSAALAQLLPLPSLPRASAQGMMIIFSSVSLESSWSTTLKWDSESLESLLFSSQSEFINFISSRLKFYGTMIGLSAFQDLVQNLDPSTRQSINKHYLSR